MKNTKNYNLNLPEANDFYDVEHYNENFEELDTHLHSVQECVTKILTGEAKVKNTDQLDGHNSDYFAKSEDFFSDVSGVYMQGGGYRVALDNGILSLNEVEYYEPTDDYIITPIDTFVTETKFLSHISTDKFKTTDVGADIKEVAENTDICPLGCITYLRMYLPLNAPINGDFYVTVKRLPGYANYIKVTAEHVTGNNTYDLYMIDGVWGDWVKQPVMTDLITLQSAND